MGRLIRATLGTAGVVALVLGGLAVVAPTFVTETEPFSSVVRTAADVGPQTLFVLGSVAATLYLVASLLHSRENRRITGDRSASVRFDRTLVDPPESVSAADGTLVGGAFDAAIERAIEGDERALERVRDRLQRLAVARVTRESGARDGTASADAVRRAVAIGTWTDNRTAAAFCADARGPTASLGSRLRLWLDPETERERRVRQTVAAIGSIGAPAASGQDRPVRSESERADEAENPAVAADGPGESTAGGVGR